MQAHTFGYVACVNRYAIEFDGAVGRANEPGSYYVITAESQRHAAPVPIT